MTANEFAKVPEWVLYAAISDKAVRLYAVLRRYDRTGRGRGAYVAKAKLARELMRCSTRSIERAVDELVAIGAIAILTPIGAPTRYRVFDVPNTGPDKVVRPTTKPKPPATQVSQVDESSPATTMSQVEAQPATPVSHHLRHESRTTCDTGVAQKESTERELLKETKSSSRASSNGTTVVSHQDDDDDGVEIDRQVVEVRRLVILRKLEQRNREMTERGKTKRVIPLTNKARVEGYIRTVLENDQSEFDDIARTFIVEERDRPLEEIALRLAPDLIHDDLPADMNGTQDWMATSREQLA